MTIHWKAAEQYFTVVLFVFQFYSVGNFGKFMNFGLGTIESERVNQAFEPIRPLLSHCCYALTTEL